MEPAYHHLSAKVISQEFEYLIMTDLTLNEFRDIQKEDLKKVLEEEVRKMFGPDYKPHNVKKKTGLSAKLFQNVKRVSRKP